MRRDTYIPPHIKDEHTTRRHARPAKAVKTASIYDETTVSDKQQLELHGTGKCQFKAWVYWDGDRPQIYDEKMPNTECVSATFSGMTHDMWTFLEPKFIEVTEEHGDKMVSYNFSTMHMVLFRWMLVEWSLPIPLERLEDGQLTDESYDRVMGVHPHLLEHFIRQYASKLFLKEEEKKQLARQAVLLFSPRGGGVRDACSAISLYCTLAGFWDKFGLTYFDIQKLPQEVFVQLRTVLNYEMDIKNSRAKESANKPRTTRGRGGKMVRTPFSRF